jgi:hypothetical protein
MPRQFEDLYSGWVDLDRESPGGHVLVDQELVKLLDWLSN